MGPDLRQDDVIGRSAIFTVQALSCFRASSTAAITVAALIVVRQRLSLSRCLTQPSLRHGTHGPAPCTRCMRPLDCEPTSCQGLVATSCRAGHGPHFTRLLGPNSAT